MNDDSVQIRFGAKIDELVAGMQQLSSKVQEHLNKVNDSLQATSAQSQQNAETIKKSNEDAAASFKDLESSVKSAFNSVESAISKAMNIIGTIAAILEGGALFKGVIDATVKWDTETANLSRTLGINMERASDLNAALRTVGTTADTYTSAFMKLERQLKSNEQGLNDLGIVTRDANGQLVDGETLMQNALSAMQQYKVGTDQSLFAITAFGRGAAQIAPLLRLNNEVMAEARQKAKDFGLEIGTEDVQAMHDYQVEVNSAKLVLEKLEEEIGVEVMKVLKALASWMTGEGVTAIGALDGALKGLEQFLEGICLQAAAAKTALQELADLPSALLHPSAYLAQVRENERQWQEKKAAFDTKYQTGDFVGPPTPPGFPKKQEGQQQIYGDTGGKKTMPGPEAAAGAGGKSDVMSRYGEELNQKKLLYENWYTWSDAREGDFWAQKLAQTSAGSAEAISIYDKMMAAYKNADAEKQADLQRQAAFETQIDRNIAAMKKTDADEIMKTKKQQYDTEYSLGQRSAAQRLALEKETDTKAYGDALTAYYSELASLTEHGQELIATQSAIYAQMEKLKADYNLKMQTADDQYLRAEKQKYDQYATEVGSALTGILFQHKTMLQTMQSLTERVFNTIINSALKQMVGAWLTSEAQKTAATQGGAATRSAVEQTGFFSSMLSKIGQQLASWLGFETGKTAATTTGATARTTAEMTAAAVGKAAESAADLSTIMADAGVAAAGAYAATACIPYVGPALAPGAASTAMATVMGYSGMVGLDVGAWKVPHDMAAMVHSGETIMPASFAEGYRGAMENGGGNGGRGGGRGNMMVNIQANDAESFAKQLGRSNSELNRLMKRAIRDFNFPLKR